MSVLRRRVSRPSLTMLARLSAAVFGFVSLAFVSAAFVAGSSLTSDLIRSDAVRVEATRRLNALLPGVGTAEIGGISTGLAPSGSARLMLDRVILTGADGQRLGAGKIAFGVKLLPLLRERFEVHTITISDADLNLSGMFPEREERDWAVSLAEFDAEAALAAVARRISGLENGLRRSAVEVVTFRNVRLGVIERLGWRSREAFVRSLRIESDSRYTEGLSAEGTIRLTGRDVGIDATWQARDGSGPERELRARVRDFDLGELPRVLKKGRTPLEIAAPLDLSLSIPFDAAGRPGRGYASARVGPGRMWFGDVAPTPLSSAHLSLRLDPVRSSIAVLPSSFSTASANGSFVGGIKRVGGKTLEYELVTRDLRSRAGGANRHHGGGLAFGGALDLDAKALRISRLEFEGPGGRFEGTGSMDLSAWTPGVAFDLRADRLEVETLKAYWPPFFASPVRRWLAGGAVTGGVVRNASLSTDIPPGAIAALRTGRAFGPAELSLTVPVEGAALRLPGDLPPIEDARGTLYLVGSSLTGALEGGVARSSGGGDVQLAGSRISIADYRVKGLPARIEVRAAGPARDLVQLAGTAPLRISQAVGIAPMDVSGSAIVKADVRTTLLPRAKRTRPLWTAEAEIVDGAIARPFKGRRIEKADVRIVAAPARVQIDGIATVDGLRTRLALVEPFGDAPTKRKASRQVALRMSEADRRRLGLNLPEILDGPVDVRLETGADGWQAVRVDLTRATLALPFLNWRKGKNISARATFRYRTARGVTEVVDLKLTGDGFGATGSLSLDGKGLREATLDNVALSGTDRASVKAKRTGRGYRIDIEADDYDARSLLAESFGKAGGSADAANGGRGRPKVAYEIRARLGKVRGFAERPAQNVRLSLDLRGSTIGTFDLRGEVAGRPVTATVRERGTAQRIELDASDAGALLGFTGLYGKMRGGTLQARLTQSGTGIYGGDVLLKEFVAVDEPKLHALLASGQRNGETRPNRVRIAEAAVSLRKAPGQLLVTAGRLRGGDMAATFEGNVYDRAGKMALKGTFLPAYGLNRMVSAIPFVGLATGNGRKSGLLGITFRLNGDWRSPRLSVNPLSVLAPGVFRKIFE